jgi:HSP20 family protein
MKRKNKDKKKSAPPAVTETVAPVDTWPSFARWIDSALATGDAMKLEEFRDDGSLVVRAELPGIDPQRDVEVTVSDGLLRIHAHRKQETTSDDKDGYRSEFRYGAFTRVLPLPAGASEDDVSASYTDGILEVRLPVDAEQAAARTVPVSTT